MIIETELKLTINPDDIAKLIELPFLQDYAYKPMERYVLTYTYYDTAGFTLLEHGYALRIRPFENQYIQTIKTANVGHDGLHQREEYHHTLTDPFPDISVIPSVDLRVQLSLEPHALMPIFITDMRRISWYICYHDAQVEIALDEGVIKAGHKTKAISEIELELFDGEVEVLTEIAAILRAHINLVLENKSKAEYGYALLGG